MNTDLMMLLRDCDIQRGHPVLAALMYLYCPAAVRWWLAGAEPVVKFDPLWAALKNRSEGKTLRGVLKEWGYEELMPYARKYLVRVDAYRTRYRSERCQAPELLPTFINDGLPLGLRHSHRQAFRRIGGWENFFPFIRAWALTPFDWQQALNSNSPLRISRVVIEIEFSNFKPVRFPLWSIESLSGKRLGYLGTAVESASNFIGEVVLHYVYPTNQIRFQELYVLETSGGVRRFDPQVIPGKIPGLIKRLASIANAGPYPPVRALERASGCKGCGYVSLCWDGDSISQLAIGF